MTDAGRQTFANKVSAALKPDSQKTTTEHLGDKVKGNSDNVAASLEPQSQKSTTQALGDKLTGHGANSDSNSSHTNPSLVDKVKHTVGLGGTHNNN